MASKSRRDLFEFYCATCHGRDGKSNGPAAGALRGPPDPNDRLNRIRIDNIIEYFASIQTK
jgi:mono/diheme cytochrome c family protein